MEEMLELTKIEELVNQVILQLEWEEQ